jgi:microcystin-dependent protein
MKQLLCAAALALLAASTPATAFRGDQYVGEVRAFPLDYCPEEWVPADGRLMLIAGNVKLFSLLSTRYGGDGSHTFALPDLRGAALVSKDQDSKKHWNGDPMMPVAQVHWCIAIEGNWPARH